MTKVHAEYPSIYQGSIPLQKKEEEEKTSTSLCCSKCIESVLLGLHRSSTPVTAAEMMDLITLLLLCLLALLLLVAAWQRLLLTSTSPKWVPLHCTVPNASGGYHGVDPGRNFSALRFEAGIGRRLNGQGVHLAHQPIDVFFHQDFQPRNEQAIAIHFKNNNTVLVSCTPLHIRPDFVPTEPSRVFLDYGRLDLVPPDLYGLAAEESTLDDEDEDAINRRICAQLENDCSNEERRWSTRRWHRRVRFLMRELLEPSHGFPYRYNLSRTRLSLFFFASVSAGIILAIVGDRWFRTSSSLSLGPEPHLYGPNSGDSATKTTARHTSQPLVAIHHLQSIFTSWAEIPQVLLAVDVNNTTDNITYELESTIYQDAGRIIADLCWALELVNPITDDNTYFYQQNLCALARYHADQASLLWSRIYAAYTEHNTRPLDTAASYLQLVAFQLRELSDREALQLEGLVDGPDAKERSRRERRAWVDVSSLVTPRHGKGDESMVMMIQGANIKRAPTPFPSSRNDDDEDEADLRDDEVHMYQLWETVIERGRLSGEQEAGEYAYLALNCDVSQDNDGVYHPACHFLIRDDDDDGENLDTDPSSLLTTVLRTSQSLIQDHIREHISSSDKILTKHQFTAFDHAKWGGNPSRVSRSKSDETLLLATLRHSWSVQAAALELMQFTDSTIQQKMIPWNARMSMWDPRPKSNSRKEAKNSHDMQNGPSIPALEALRELYDQQMALIFQRGVEIGVRVARIYHCTNAVKDRIRELRTFRGGGGIRELYEWSFERRRGRIVLELVHRTIPPLPEQASMMEEVASAMGQATHDVAGVLQQRMKKVLLNGSDQDSQSPTKEKGGSFKSLWIARYILNRYDKVDEEDAVRQVKTAAGGHYIYWWRPPYSDPSNKDDDTHPGPLLKSDGDGGDEFDDDEAEDLYGNDPTENWDKELPPWGSSVNDFDNTQENLLDCYEILGVEDTASHREIKQASRRLLVKLHPDKKRRTGHEGKDEANAFWAEFSKARATLENPEARRKYDEQRKAVKDRS